VRQISKNLTQLYSVGALFSIESIRLVSSILRQNTQIKSIIDAEPFFKTGPTPKPEVVTAFRTDLLPLAGLVSATVPEVKGLLDNAGIPFDYPTSMQDVQSMANTLRGLGPKYVIIKREIHSKDDRKTTLHFVLCGDGDPVVSAYSCNNPGDIFGASYSIPRKWLKGICYLQVKWKLTMASGYCGVLGQRIWCAGSSICRFPVC
jgi:hydroxymethylpyrimidine/phosphomethylpyrimidine kinase